MQIFKKHTCTYMAKKDTERKVTKLYWFEMNKTRKTVTLIYLKVYSLVCVMQRLCGHPIQGHSVLKIAWKYKKTPPPQPHPLSIYCFTAHVIEVVAEHCVLYIFTKSVCAMEDWASFRVLTKELGYMKMCTCSVLHVYWNWCIRARGWGRVHLANACLNPIIL